MTDTPAFKPEFSRSLDIRQAEVKAAHRVEADAAERAALAVRFGLVRIDRLAADIELERRDRKVEGRGRIKADYIQACAVSAEDIAVSLDEPVYFRFVPQAGDHTPDEEIELDSDDCDEVEYTGSHIDLGEAVAQSLALAIDPFLTGPEADAARKAAGIGTPENSGPFAALKGLGLKE
ncbi:YceD family protein [Novosphingobium sp.]|uniref:YceD family protein n=1 Tax=Novosphingobium sp. TaxID=1874826 RepID=UPI003D6CE3F8